MSNKLVRPKKTEGWTIEISTGCGDMFVTINKVDGKIFEIFARLGKAGGCATAQLEAITRSITLGLRLGNPVEEYIKQMEYIRCTSPSITANPTIDEHEEITSCADAIAKALKWQISENAGSGIKQVEDKNVN